MQKIKYGQGGVIINKKLIQIGKKIFAFLCDKKLLIGIGIGMSITSVILMGYEYKGSISKERIEKEARDLGMHYEDECKVILKGGQ